MLPPRAGALGTNPSSSHPCRSLSPPSPRSCALPSCLNGCLLQYNLAFYLQYLVKWPEYFEAAETPSGRFMGYVMGKAEGKGTNWHGHVTALTVAPEFRRIGLGGAPL